MRKWPRQFNTGKTLPTSGRVLLRLRPCGLNRVLESEYEMHELLMGRAGIDRIVADAEGFLA